jgi:hypothetical protein
MLRRSLGTNGTKPFRKKLDADTYWDNWDKSYNKHVRVTQ